MTRTKVGDRKYAERVRRACLDATRAIDFALDAPPGTQERSVLVEGARSSSIDALSHLASDRFWLLFGEDEDGDPLAEQEVGDASAELRSALMDLIGHSLAQVLVEVRYQPPPEPWELVAAARSSADQALYWGQINYGYVRRQLRKLQLALQLLRVEDEAGISQEIRTTRRGLLGGAVASTVLATVLGEQANDAVTETRDHVLAPALAHVWTDLVDGNDPEPRPAAQSGPPSNGDDPDMRELLKQMQLREGEARAREGEARAREAEAKAREAEAREREAAARAELAEAEAQIAKGRLREEQMDRHARDTS